MSKSQKKKNTDELIDGLRDAFEDVKLHQAEKNNFGTQETSSPNYKVKALIDAAESE